MASKTLFAKLYDYTKRLVKFDKSFGILANGEDNLYPERVERIINNSPTAKSSAETYKKYIAGRGVESLNSKLVNPTHRTTLEKFINQYARSYSYQEGVFIHVKYNMAIEIVSLRVVPYTFCRLSKPDSEEYSAKVGVSEKFSEGNKVSKKDIDFIDVYNPNEGIIKEQIKKAGGIRKYKGQILFVNSSDYKYPLSTADNVLMDADSEYRASVYKNTILRKGFFGKTLVITKPFEGANLEYTDPELMDDHDKYRLQQLRTQRGEFEETMDKFMGSDNVDGILHLEMEHDGDDIDKEILFKNIDANIDDKMFAYTEESTENNIRKAFKNIPKGLIDSSEKAFFADSGEGIKARRLFYQDQTSEERGLLEETLNDLLSKFKGIVLPEDGIKIDPLYEIEESTEDDEEEVIEDDEEEVIEDDEEES